MWGLGIVEMMMPEDFRLSVHVVYDMCGGWSAELKQSVAHVAYYNEQIWIMLDPQLVEKGECQDLERFKKRGCASMILVKKQGKTPEGNEVNVKWVRVNRGG